MSLRCLSEDEMSKWRAPKPVASRLLLLLLIVLPRKGGFLSGSDAGCSECGENSMQTIPPCL